MAESHARDSAVERENTALALHIDRYLKARLRNGKIPTAIEGALALAEEKLREEAASIIRRWD